VNIWYLIVALSLVTFINRYIFFSRTIKFTPNKKLSHLFGFSAQAVMTSLWVPIVFRYDAQDGFSIIDYSYLFPAIIVFILSMTKLNMLVTIVIGMMSFYLFRSLA